MNSRTALRLPAAALRLRPMLGAALLIAFAVFAPAPSARAACVNEALRTENNSTQLPDCRAYERVSPAYTESATLGTALAVSPEGSSVVLGSLGIFAGAERGLLNSTVITEEAYLLSRTPAGWEPISLGPPSSTYRSGGGLLDTSADLKSSLWAMDTLAQPAGAYDFYLERPHRTFVEIGPLAPGGGTVNREHYAGASEDLSRVLFTAPQGSRWPFDATASGATLYEYLGAQQPGESGEREPDLVGVEGAHGSTALIGRCGTRLGSSSTEEESFGSVYNAISADGARVFFTAIGEDHNACGFPQPPVDELFVREATPPAQAPSTESEMTTHPISCPPAPLAPCSDANFEGASQDGSRAFFTSTARLLEGASEDTTGGDSAQQCAATQGPGGCILYEDQLTGSGDSLSQHLALVSAGSADPEVQGVARISEDGSHVYFVARGVLSGANVEGHSPVEGEDNLYVYADGQVSFIATLAPGDKADWAHEDSRPVLASGEGRFLVFTSGADLTDEGISTGEGKRQVFQYNAETGALVRASIGEEGFNDYGRDPFADPVLLRGISHIYDNSSTDSPTLAAGSQAPANGAVFFESPDALTPLALSDQRNALGELIPNVYEYRAGHVYLLSDGRDVSAVDGGPGVYLLGSDPSGGDVFFFTSDPLIPADGNTQQDLYDARAQGGFPSSPSPPSCAGEACQGPSPIPPPPNFSASAAFSGSGNESHSAKHSKGTHRRRHTSNRRHGKRDAHNDRRTGR